MASMPETIVARNRPRRAVDRPTSQPVATAPT
eukprot:CAMPEP_0176142174 /NCGR_PEP_ID=MMETSP0120_2-20121206/72323_1 /TAXON_ID=160619 /ORGANISM="Kryptoperidinium foliaceum, Strain CCMP 1326" /LENGTH=31 /DNA_ID= /DNA_START= /DNA_END= /DNA_ORIENTATION=